MLALKGRQARWEPRRRRLDGTGQRWRPPAMEEKEEGRQGGEGHAI